MIHRPDIIQNAIYIPEDDVYIKSLHVHDFVSYTTKKGKSVAVDGGCDYLKRSYDDKTIYQEYSLTEADPIETIREKLLWGTYGKDGKQPLKFKPIKSLEVDHLAAILANVPNLQPIISEVVKYWIEKKFYNNEKI
jgi:hypothetical protein